MRDQFKLPLFSRTFCIAIQHTGRLIQNTYYPDVYGVLNQTRHDRLHDMRGNVAASTEYLNLSVPFFVTPRYRFQNNLIKVHNAKHVKSVLDLWIGAQIVSLFQICKKTAFA